ncbi:MAG: ribosome maturation factor RimM [Actinomycetales bacterium]|nr:MAG: ribosome maturation factor RimM [Actinomycetales bacterium]
MTTPSTGPTPPPAGVPAGGSHVVARIGKPHGIRGEVTVQVHTDDPERRFAVGTELPTSAPSGSGVPRTLTIRSARNHRGIWLLGFHEIPDRTGAESLRGTRLLTPDDAADHTGWYADELAGLPVLLPDGTPVGDVAGLELGPGQDRLVVTLHDGHTASIPLVEAIVPVIDNSAGHVVIDPPDGLLDLGR